MGIMFRICFALPTQAKPNIKGQIEIFERYGFKNLSNAYIYTWKDGALVDEEANIITDTHLNLFDLIHENINLIQHWEGENNASFDFGYVTNENLTIGLISISSGDIDRIGIHFSKIPPSFLNLIADLCRVLNAEFLLGFSEFGEPVSKVFDAISDTTALKKIPYEETIIIGEFKKNLFNSDFLEKYSRYNFEYGEIYSKWPLVF